MLKAFSSGGVLRLTFVVLWPGYVVRALIHSISGEQHPGWAVEGSDGTSH